MIEALIDPWPPFTFCCPQAIVDQEAEVSIPNLISLLPLDEVPVHAPLRRPRPLRFERLRVPVWKPYSRSRLSPAKSEDRKGGEGKADANLTIFLSTCRTDRPRRGMALSCFLSVAFGFEATGELGELEARNGARPSNSSLSDLLFPFFSALSRVGLGFDLPPGRIGSEHLLSRPTHRRVNADDEALLGEHGFFRYRPDFLQVLLAQRLDEPLFKVAVQRRERRQRFDEDPGVPRHTRADGIGEPIFFRNPRLLVRVDVQLADFLHLLVGARARPQDEQVDPFGVIQGSRMRFGPVA